MKKWYKPLIVVVIILLNVLLFYKIFAPLIYALLVSYMLLPLNDFFERLTKNRDLASLVTVLVILIPLVLILIATMNIVVNETLKFLESPDNFLSNVSKLEEYLKELGTEVSISSQVNSLIKEIESSMNIKTTFNLIRDISYTSIEILLFLFSTFYFLRDGRKLKGASDTCIPEEIKGWYLKLTEELGKALQGLFYGYIITAAITGAVGGFFFYILGLSFHVPYFLNYSVLIGFLIFLFGLLPVLGAPMVYGPIAVVEAFNNPLLSLIILVFGITVLTYVPAFVLTPYISEKKCEIHPLIILFGFIAGPVAFGMSGFILGPLLLCLLVAVYRVEKEEV
ncbi:MAG: AI-2E family transporter [Euryarchaeota archaeon]|nr:AI-2E family transporter [Euryarchaeota archaeon]